MRRDVPVRVRVKPLSIKTRCVAQFIFKVAHYVARTQRRCSKSITTLQRLVSGDTPPSCVDLSPIAFLFLFLRTVLDIQTETEG